HGYLLLGWCRHARTLRSCPSRRSSDLKFLRRRRIRIFLFGSGLLCGGIRSGGGCSVVSLFLFAQKLGKLHSRKREYLLKRRHRLDRKSTRLNSSHVSISYAVFCLKKKR